MNHCSLASLFITNSQSLPKLMSTESVMPSNHLILCHPLLLPPSVFPSSNESVLCIRWPKYWSFIFNVSPSSEHSGLTNWWTGWISLQSKGLSRVFSNTTVQKLPSSALSFLYSPTLTLRPNILRDFCKKDHYTLGWFWLHPRYWFVV